MSTPTEIYDTVTCIGCLIAAFAAIIVGLWAFWQGCRWFFGV